MRPVDSAVKSSLFYFTRLNKVNNVEYTGFTRVEVSIVLQIASWYLSSEIVKSSWIASNYIFHINADKIKCEWVLLYEYIKLQVVQVDHCKS